MLAIVRSETLLGALAFGLIGLIGCGPAVANLESSSRLAPAELYSCVVRALAQLNYTLQTADRDAGLVKAEKKASGTATALFSGAAYYNEITALVLPPQSGGPPSLKLTLVRSKQEGRGSRTSTGMVVTGDLKKDGATLQKSCAGV